MGCGGTVGHGADRSSTFISKSTGGCCRRPRHHCRTRRRREDVSRTRARPHRDYALDILDQIESRDLYDLLLERYRTGSVIVTSNRSPDECLATFADPVRAQSAIDRFTSNVCDLVIERESYRPRPKPRLAKRARSAADEHDRDLAGALGGSLVPAPRSSPGRRTPPGLSDDQRQ